MIVELRTYLLRPGSVQQVEDLFAEHLPYRTAASPMAGLWHTLAGQLNTVVHLWPYDSVQQRCDVREAMMIPPKWPPPLRPFLVEMDSVILQPVPFSPRLEPAEHGTLYEFCFDSYLPGGVGACRETWEPAIERRQRESPLVFCGTSEFGRLNQWVHIWAYRNHEHRDEVHAKLKRDGEWPPAGGRDLLQRQDSFFAAPAACSLLR